MARWRSVELEIEVLDARDDEVLLLLRDMTGSGREIELAELV